MTPEKGSQKEGNMPEQIKNAIVDYGVKPADQFLAHPNNPRRHPPAQRRATAASLRKVGWVLPVIENRRTGYLLDSHERVWQALAQGNAMVPFVTVDVDEADEAFVLATLDPIAALAEIDAGMYQKLMEQIETDDDAIRRLLANVAAQASYTAIGFERDVSMPEASAPAIGAQAFQLRIDSSDHEILFALADLVKAEAIAKGWEINVSLE